MDMKEPISLAYYAFSYDSLIFMNRVKEWGHTMNFKDCVAISVICIIFSFLDLVGVHSLGGLGGDSSAVEEDGAQASLEGVAASVDDQHLASCQVLVGGCWNSLQDCLFVIFRKIQRRKVALRQLLTNCTEYHENAVTTASYKLKLCH